MENNISIELDKELCAKTEKEYKAENYTSTIKTAILHLSESIRERTGVEGDGDKLVTTVFSEKNPLIKLNSLKTETERNEQTGYMQIMQGLYRGIRNPRNHNLKSDDKFTCDSILVLINLLLSRIKEAKPYFDFNDLINRVNDRHFCYSTEYSDAIVKLIPESKMLDSIIGLFDHISEENHIPIAHVVFSAMHRLSNEEKERFFDYCSDILQKTGNYDEIKVIVFAVRGEWGNLSEVAKIRIEGMMVTALKNFQQYNEDMELLKVLQFIPFTERLAVHKLFDTIMEKMSKGSVYIDFIFKYLYKYIVDDNRCIRMEVEAGFIAMLNSGNHKIYEILLKDYHYSDEVAQAIESYKQKKLLGKLFMADYLTKNNR